MSKPTHATESDPAMNGINESLTEFSIGNPTRIVLKKVIAKSPTQVRYQFQTDRKTPDLTESAKQKSSATGRIFCELTKIKKKKLNENTKIRISCILPLIFKSD